VHGSLLHELWQPWQLLHCCECASQTTELVSFKRIRVPRRLSHIAHSMPSALVSEFGQLVYG
jgi:hypothetical protein